ncbi:MAG TPA: hypothetical protein V6D33_11775 [Cyanophyceae cyanobacterium]
MATPSSAKPTDSAKPTTGQPTSNLFNAFQPSSSANASNYNPYNSQATNQALADQNAAGYWAGQGQLQQAKEAAGFGAQQGVLTQSAQSANQAASQQQQQQQQQLNSFSSTTGVGQGIGTLAFGGQQPQAPKQDLLGRPLGTAQNLQDQMALRNQEYQQSDRTAAINAANQIQQMARQQSGDQSLTRIQGENQIEAAKVAANAQLGAAALGAQSNMVSSLFGSLGNMTASIGGGGGRRGYW